MAKTTLSNSEWATAGFKDFANEEFVSAPNTQIANRAQVSNSLKPSLGVERVLVRSISQLPKEFGPNGELVWEADSKDARIRFVGNWNTSVDSNGTRARTDTVSDFAETTFYGTGLNLLHRGQSSPPSVLTTVDGGTESVTSIIVTQNAVLGARNYNTNQIVPIVSGLGLGWHTVKLRLSSGSAFEVYGYEVLNERSNILFPAGSAFSGMKKQSALSALSSSYNASVVGAKGARVVKYILDGAISEAVQAVDATQLNYSSANHTNEEVVKVINFKEFMANRGDDFSASGVTNVNKSYALDDGSTILACSNGNIGTAASTDVLYPSSASSFWNLQFVGTGLDVMITSHNGASGNTANYSVIVDGTTVFTGAIAITPTFKQLKLVSGLPYGSHNVRLFVSTTGGAGDVAMNNFIIYQPKKPAIPAGAVELADYNVMADLVGMGSASAYTMSTGVLRKSPSREIVYTGTTTINLDPAEVTGFYTQGNQSGGTAEYTFFGTGFELRCQNPSSSYNGTISLNGTTLTAANFATATFTSTGPAMSFVSSTGVLTISNSAGYGQGFRVSGLPLGKYTFKITHNNTAGFNLSAFDIITPIHYATSSYKVGNQALKDSRSTKPTPIPEKGIDLSKAKAWILYNQVNNTVLASYNISAVVNVGTGDSLFYFIKPMKSANYVVVSTGDQQEHEIYAAFDLKPNYFEVLSHNSGGTLANDLRVGIVVFGELEDES